MIDNFCIVFSTVMCLIVVVRAIKLDKLPWFERQRSEESKPTAGTVAQPSSMGWRARAALSRTSTGRRGK
jgi:hypothetical protein